MRPRPFHALHRPEWLGLIAVSLALGFLAACHQENPEDTADPAPAAEQPAPASKDSSSEADSKEPSGAAAGPSTDSTLSPLAKQRDALTAFLNSENWKERLATIYQADQLKKAIADYYSDGEHSDGPIGSYELEFFHLDESTADGGPYYIFFVITPEMPDGFPAFVRGTSEGYKVDWECFVEFHDQHFTSFHESGLAGPREFRVVLRRSDYWGPDRSQFTNLNDYLSYRVDLPYVESDYYAFLSKTDPLVASMNDKVSWGKPPLATIVRLQRVEFPHGAKHLKIVKVITEGWHRAPSNKDH